MLSGGTLILSNQIQALLNTALKNYLAEKAKYRTASNDVPSKVILVNQLPALFKVQPGIPKEYFIKGSIGEGVMTEHPWICFLDPDVSKKSVRSGYYVCLLTRKDMQGFYLSLNQGWTQYKDTYGTKLGRKEILKNSIKAREILRSAPDYETSVLDLAATGGLGKGYEVGNIYSKFYSINDLPTDKELLDDIISLIGVHRELKAIVGPNILNIWSLSSEEDFQKEAQKSPKASLPTGPIKKPEPKNKSSSSSKWGRDPSIGSVALEAANYCCEYDANHETFISKASEKKFVEVHHLVPMENQNDFDVSLDVPENIVALCPTCHRKIHLASEREKRPLLEKFLKERKDKLAEREIYIDAKQLNEIYKQLESTEY